MLNTKNDDMKDVLERVLMGLLLCVSCATASAALEFTIPAPNGIGDVVALTNAIFQINQANNSNTKLFLEQGVYDLSGIKSMYGSGTTLNGAHLYFNTTCKNALIAGLGDKPENVILKGDGTLGVFHIWSTDVNNPTIVSNLTITGGRRNSDGGGIYGSSNGGLILKNLIVTNNYATGLAGGVLRAKMYNCLIADNHSTGNKGGGFWSDTNGMGAYDCVFSNNTTVSSGGGFYSSGSGGFLIGCELYDNAALDGSGAVVYNGFVSNCVFKGNGPSGAVNSDKVGGGLYISGGECVDCHFIGNHADRGGGAYIGSSATVLRDCTFEGNIQKGWASGAAVYVNASSPLALVSNCVFNANITRQSSQTVISNAELVDCVITNHHGINGYLLAGCNMTRCYVADNSAWGNGQNLDIATAYGTTAVSRTNVNCIVVRNIATNGMNSITHGKTVVNCTYCGNRVDAGGDGANVLYSAKVYNTLLSGNSIGKIPLDIRNGGNAQPYMTNCVVSIAGSGIDSAKFVNCKVVPNFKFRPTEDGGEYDIKGVSSVFNAGVLEDWMVPVLGETDFAGRKRVKFDAIDIGALECQIFPYTAIIFR